MNKHLIYINLDGFGRYYYDLTGLEARALPNIGRLIENGVFFENAYTGIPSITCPMQAGIVSGCGSLRTGNCDKYWDRRSHEIVYSRRSNEAQTIGESMAEEGRTFVSIQQFALEEKGALRGEKERLYIEPGGDYRNRFSILLRLIRENVVEDGCDRYEYPEFPEAVFLYVDDLDAVGHNPARCYADTEKQRVKNVSSVLKGIDSALGEVLDSLKERRLLEDTYLLLTTDHGMVSYRGKSRIEDLAAALESKGYRVKVCREGNTGEKEFDILLTSHDIECQMYLSDGISPSCLDMAEENAATAEPLREFLMELPFVESVMTKEELAARGVCEKYADILISPREGESFSLYPLDKTHLYAGHDSLHEKCQHIFSAMAGPGIRKGYREECRVYNKDFIPTLISCMGFKPLKDSDGRILESVMEKRGGGGTV